MFLVSIIVFVMKVTSKTHEKGNPWSRVMGKAFSREWMLKFSPRAWKQWSGKEFRPPIQRIVKIKGKG